MDYCCYIIYSISIGHYYVGYTSNIEERLIQHNEGFFGPTCFTSKAKDWKIFLVIPCETIEHAMFIETKIKNMKSRKYIENLRKYPEIIKKLSKSGN